MRARFCIPLAVWALVQGVGVWVPESGWQVVHDRPVGPDLLVVGQFGDPYTPPWVQDDSPRKRIDRTYMPRLELRCENGVTALTLLLPVHRVENQPPQRRVAARDTYAARSAEESFSDRLLVLAFEDGERIELDPDAARRDEPILVPDPYDTIGRLRRHDTVYYTEITRGTTVWLDYTGLTPSPPPTAVFPLEGLDDVLRDTRDPCAWRAS